MAFIQFAGRALWKPGRQHAAFRKKDVCPINDLSFDEHVRYQGLNPGALFVRCY